MGHVERANNEGTLEVYQETLLLFKLLTLQSLELNSFYNLLKLLL